ncbi:murein biosynthesis integral membrane protein MurJ [Bacillus cereus group sp. BceL101]|uniref:murein biosynthesis integral membrane protein MurJ n=2 Tax=Bacillaceae TaxID=186817 RepID=UPI0003088361|nr:MULTISPECIES: murein biosynthesis integral membrane protein MurJ [Bacillus]MBR2705424.1 murein biosynthesis integral membrane protein MurJ [Clostridia bacterium]ASK17332.1 murein biosynthesis integral membrane protein MurJ [Bacillus cereus]KXY92536.1 virulence factor MviN [Bacillus cereus]MBL3785837.1 murein biosynthesis integral membrane protein MurJ [Bacillus cereus]MBL3798243.1 murein biosynthesis integral membrane protein MurJ [Bacillus cereus]
MNKIFKSSFLIILVILLSKILGFIREFFIVYVFGVSLDTDAFLIASVVPQLLFSTIDLAFAAILIPIIQEVKINNKDKLPGFLLALSLSTSIILILVTGLGLLFNKNIINLVAVGSNSDVKDLAVVLTQILMPMIIFQGIIQILIAALRVLDRPIIGNFIGIPYNILVIFGIFVGKNYWGIYGVSIFILIGTALQSVLLIVYGLKLRMFKRFEFSEQKLYLKKVVILGVPTLFSTLFAQLQVISERVLSSSLETGSITIIFYVNKFFTLIVFILLTLINSILYPQMSKWVLTEDKGNFEEKINLIIKYVVIILIPISLFVCLNADGLIYMVLGHGNLDEKSLYTISMGFGIIIVGLVGIILKDILLKVFFSKQKVRIATHLSIISIIFNIVLSIAFCKLWGIYGIIWANPLSAYATCILLFYVLNRKMQMKVRILMRRTEIVGLFAVNILLYLGHYLINLISPNIYINVILNGLYFLVIFGGFYWFCARKLPRKELLYSERI